MSDRLEVLPRESFRGVVVPCAERTRERVNFTISCVERANKRKLARVLKFNGVSFRPVTVRAGERQ